MCRGQADALVVNIGTNDMNYAETPAYISTYIKLVMNASRHYGACTTATARHFGHADASAALARAPALPPAVAELRPGWVRCTLFWP